MELLTREQETELLLMRTPEAEAELIERNIGLVGGRIRKHLVPHVGVEDLMQAGCIGLLTAIRKWLPEFDCKLSTYARSWIDSCMHDEVMRSQPIRVPDYLSDRKCCADHPNQAFAHPQVQSLHVQIRSDGQPTQLWETLPVRAEDGPSIDLEDLRTRARQRVLELLPPRMAETVIAVCLEGLTMDEIAQRDGKHYSTVNQAFNKGIQKLEKGVHA